MRQSLDSREIEEFVKKLLFRVPYVLWYVRPGHMPKAARIEANRPLRVLVARRRHEQRQQQQHGTNGGVQWGTSVPCW